MAYTYIEGEKKVRPGVYQRTSSTGSTAGAGALNGVVALVMAANWGPVDKATVHETAKSIRETYGTGANVEAACSLMAAGASRVYIKRLDGKNGTAGTIGTALIDPAIKIDTKYPTSRTLTVEVKAKIGESAKKQVTIKEGNTILESFDFAANGDDESYAFLDAVAGSAYINATRQTDGAITIGEYSLNGTDPTNVTADYADAFYALEPFAYNVLVTDSIDADVRALLCAYSAESETSGKLIVAVTGDKPSTAFETRLANATACNSERIVFFGGSWLDSTGKVVEGAPAIIYVAGVIAATPANRGIVHSQIAGATDVPEKLTNAQYIEAINKGLLLVSAGPDGQVWFDSAINTLVTPKDGQDEGWKKIRRVKTRYELMDRIDRTLAPKVGKVNCSNDGIAYIIQCGTGVIKEMIAENKLSAGSFYEDPERPHQGDSAWFIVEADDIDSLEKIYLHYQYRYSAV